MAVAPARTLTPAVPVPDEAFWIAAGIDLRREGIEPRLDPGAADALIVPIRIPAPLLEALDELRLRLPDPSSVRPVEGPELGGEPAEAVASGSIGEALADEAGEESDGEGDDGGHDHGDDGGHDHGDMMAVTGDPSADGLIMEDAELSVGPIAAALPTGIVLRLTLDGDVACAASLRSGLGAAAPALDPLAPQACRWAAERARGPAAQDPGHVRRRLAGVEIERALSHVAWLARFLRLLGWVEAAERLAIAAAPLIDLQRRSLDEGSDGEDGAGLGDCHELEEGLRGLVGSRRLAGRCADIATVAADSCRELGLRGPIARAAGIDVDARSADPAYRELGFSPVVGSGGDARARAELRVEEALASIGLARLALAADSLPAVSGEVESPRGPLATPSAGPAGAAAILPANAAATVAAAEAAVVGHELARALVAVASFDLSPWQVGR